MRGGLAHAGNRKRLQMNNNFSILILAVTLLVSTSCYSEKPRGYDEYMAMEAIPYSDAAARRRKFDSFEIDKQLDLYLFTQRGVEGSKVHVAEYIEEDGERYVDDITRRIEASSNEGDKFYLLGALVDIERRCRCVANNPTVMQRLREARTTIDESHGEVDRLHINAYSERLERLSNQKEDGD